MGNKMLESALYYVRECGFQVMPLNEYKKPLLVAKRDSAGVKDPNTGWKRYQTERTTPKLIREWWARWPDANIGIITGRISNLLVLDADNEDANKVLANALGNGHHPIIRTPNGYHWYFNYPMESSITIGQNFIKDCDWRGESGYVVAAPSITAAVQERDAAGNVTKKGGPYERMEGRAFLARPTVPASVEALCYGGRSNKRVGGGLGGGEGTIGGSNSLRDPPLKNAISPDDNVANYFQQGTRDEDLFHAANIMFKGGGSPDFIRETLHIVGKNCGPPFPPHEVEAKIESAMDRQNAVAGNLAAEVREWVLSSSGVFLSSEIYRDLNLSSRDVKKNCSKVLERMRLNGDIEKAGEKRGSYRTVNLDRKPSDWKTAECGFVDITLPLDLTGMVCMIEGSMMVIAGTSNSGKSTMMTWLARHNMDRWKVRYLSTETSAGMFHDLASKHRDIVVDDWDVQLYEDMTVGDLPAYVLGGVGCLTLIDYVEVYDNFYEVGKIVRDLHERVNGGILVAAIQKKRGAREGLGGHFNQMKPHIGLSLEYDHKENLGYATLTKAKIPKPEHIAMFMSHPQEKQCVYKLIDNHQYSIKSTPNWRYPPPKEK